LITVVSWLWKQPQGRTTYTAEHVWIWADMVSRNLSMKHRLACVTTETDLPPNVERIDPPGEFEDVEPKWGPRKPNCFRRLTMFRKDAAKTFGKRFVSMDLDVVIGGQLDPLFDRPEDLVLYRGTDPSRPYNGSMMLLKAGCRPEVYEDFDQAGADVSGEAFHGSDQAWLAHKLGWNEATWTEDDGVYWFGRRFFSDKRCRPRVLFFPGKMKPWKLAPIRIYPFVSDNYRILEAREAA
jgi:hypothetical protein